MIVDHTGLLVTLSGLRGLPTEEAHCAAAVATLWARAPGLPRLMRRAYRRAAQGVEERGRLTAGEYDDFLRGLRNDEALLGRLRPCREPRPRARTRTRARRARRERTARTSVVKGADPPPQRRAGDTLPAASSVCDVRLAGGGIGGRALWPWRADTPPGTPGGLKSPTARARDPVVVTGRQAAPAPRSGASARPAGAAAPALGERVRRTAFSGAHFNRARSLGQRPVDPPGVEGGERRGRGGSVSSLRPGGGDRVPGGPARSASAAPGGRSLFLDTWVTTPAGMNRQPNSRAAVGNEEVGQ